LDQGHVWLIWIKTSYFSFQYGGYPPAGPGYPSAAPGYPPAAPGYQSAAPGYPGAAPGYPSATPGYPPSGGYPQPGYPSGGGKRLSQWVKICRDEPDIIISSWIFGSILVLGNVRLCQGHSGQEMFNKISLQECFVISYNLLPDNLVPLCKFKIIIIIHFFRN
jgi:hypothetical protein